MLLILEIALTVFAWKRGWKGWALLPIGIALFCGFLFGLAMGGSADPLESIDSIGILMDIACVGSLIGMIAKPRLAVAPKKEPEQKTQNIEIKPF